MAKNVQAKKARRKEERAGAGELELVVPKLQRNTLNEEVYEQLKHALMSGRIAPGSDMTIRSLAKSFGISPMPVREALRRLVAEHVLVLLPNRSVSLPIITRERFREITRIRTSLEGLAAEEATPLVSAEVLRRMAALNDEMERPGQTRHPEYLIKNREFHFYLYQSSRLPTLVKIIEALWLQIGPLLTIQQQEFASEGVIVQTQHRRLLKALKKGDAAEARDAIVDDIEDAAKIIGETL
jgi:DNA-binding GntR family transcriptional regulator